jgi:hypothetical protein
LDLFNKEKEEQEVENKEFDPEQGINIHVTNIDPDFNKLRKKSLAAKKYKETHTGASDKSNFIALEHGDSDFEEPSIFLADEDLICDNLESLEEITSFYQKNIENF